MPEISDGYGGLSEVEEFLMEEESFFVRNARHMLVQSLGRGFPAGADEDAIQEARIAAWQSYTKHHNPAYANIAVRQRLIEHVVRDRWFGMPKPSGHEKDPIRRKGRDSFDDPHFEVDTVVQAEEMLEAVLMAYHHGEIVEAINELAPDHRDYVVMRFWWGMSNPQIAKEQGKTAGGVSSVWTKTIRPHLLERLGHLVGAL